MGHSNSKLRYSMTLDLQSGMIQSNIPPTEQNLKNLDQTIRIIFEKAKQDPTFNKCKNEVGLKRILESYIVLTRAQYNGQVNFNISASKNGILFCAKYFVTIEITPAGNYTNFSHLQVYPVQQQYYPQYNQNYNNMTNQMVFSQPVTQPVIQPVMQPVMQPVTQHVIQPVIQPVTQPVTQHVIQPVTQIVTQPVIQTKRKLRASPDILEKSTLVINETKKTLMVKISKERYNITKKEHDIKANLKIFKVGLGGERSKNEERQYNDFISEGFEKVNPNDYCQGTQCKKDQGIFVTVQDPSINTGDTEGDTENDTEDDKEENKKKKEEFIVHNKHLDPFFSLWIDENYKLTVVESKIAVEHLQEYNMI